MTDDPRAGDWRTWYCDICNLDTDEEYCPSCGYSPPVVDGLHIAYGEALVGTPFLKELREQLPDATFIECFRVRSPRSHNGG
jgi:hypothetical protein